MRIMPTLIAAILGALAVWATILAVWAFGYLTINYPYTSLVVLVTIGGASLGAYLYQDWKSLSRFYDT